MRIRVIEVLATLKRAGAENVAVALARGLDRQSFDTAVVSLYDPFPGGLEPVLEQHGVPVWHLGKRRGFDPRMYPRLAGVFRQFRPDIVHTHSYLLRYAWPAGAAARVKAIVHTVHNVALREVDLLGRLIHRAAFRRGVLPVAVGEAVARSFRDVYRFDPLATIPNGIDTSLYCRDASGGEWRRAHGFSNDDVLFTSVARLDPQKNPLGLIEAFGRALAGEEQCHLVLAGTGSLLDAARRRAAELPIRGRVHFLGIQSGVPELLAASDAFVLASRWEGSPLSVMEGMAAGLPVVATAAGCVPELVKDGETGILVRVGDVDAFAGALAALACDPRRRRELGAAGRRAAARFDISAMVAAYAALFEGIARQ